MEQPPRTGDCIRAGKKGKVHVGLDHAQFKSALVAIDIRGGGDGGGG
jgi:hypothetical protein